MAPPKPRAARSSWARSSPRARPSTRTRPSTLGVTVHLGAAVHFGGAVRAAAAVAVGASHALYGAAVAVGATAASYGAAAGFGTAAAPAIAPQWVYCTDTPCPCTSAPSRSVHSRWGPTPKPCTGRPSGPSSRSRPVPTPHARCLCGRRLDPAPAGRLGPLDAPLPPRRLPRAAIRAPLLFSARHGVGVWVFLHTPGHLTWHWPSWTVVQVPLYEIGS